MYLGKETGSENKTLPAVLIAANLEGDMPLATEGAIRLIHEVLADESHFADRTWYVIPVGNPDAASGYFEKPLFPSS